MLDRIRCVIEATNSRIALYISWLTLLMVAVTFVIVALRYVFGIGWIWLQESVVWMHAAVFMLAAAWTLGQDGHVRVDIFYRSASQKHRAMVNVFGTLVFLLPVSIFIVWTSWDYVQVSWAIREGSRETGGLPWPFPSLLKSIIPVTALLLAFQGLAILIRDGQTLRDQDADS